jgi:hypothetical protein
MDATQCLKEILDMFASGESDNREEIVDRLLSLTVWLQNNGFYPTVTSASGFYTSYIIGKME